MKSILPAITLVAVAAACVLAPPPPDAGTGQVWGWIELVPHEGVEPKGAHASAYGDRRLREVSLVDYSRPGFAVVYVEGALEGAAVPAGEARLVIERSQLGIALAPEYVAVGRAGRIVLRNDTDEDHVVSFPAAAFVGSVRAGEALTFEPPGAGELALFLLDAPDARATVFAAPGPWDQVEPSGRYVLSDLPPGVHSIRAWHPRLPPAQRKVQLGPDSVVRLDIQLGVGREPGGADAP